MVGGCCVCSDERGWAENPLVYCDGHGCNVAVHQACYGIVQVPTGPWFCRKCESQERVARVKCELCPSKDGALKRTDNGDGSLSGWAHVVCALYIPEVRFGNVRSMEPIIIASVPHDRFTKLCYICEEQGRESKASSGACMQCNKHGCKQHFHVTCAQAQGLLCEEAGNYTDNVKYCGYCAYHYRKLFKEAKPPSSASKSPDSSSIHMSSKFTTANFVETTISTTSATGTPTTETEPSRKRCRTYTRSDSNSSIVTDTVPNSTESNLKSTPSSSTISLNSIDRAEVKLEKIELPESVTTLKVSQEQNLLAAALTKPRSKSPIVSSAASMELPPSTTATQSATSFSTTFESFIKDYPLSADSPKPSNDIAPSGPGSKRRSNKSLEKGERKRSRKSKQQQQQLQQINGPGPGTDPASILNPATANGRAKTVKDILANVNNTHSPPISPNMPNNGKKNGRKKTENRNSTNLSPTYNSSSAVSTTLPSSLPGLQRSTGGGETGLTFTTDGQLTGGIHDGGGDPTHNGPTSLMGPPRAGKTGLSPRSILGDHSPGGFPATMEQLLERQWEQGSQFLMEQGQHFDIASLLNCLHQLRAENLRLEEHISGLMARRDHLLAINARLSLPLSGGSMVNNTSQQTTPERGTERSPRVNNMLTTSDGVKPELTNSLGGHSMSHSRSPGHSHSSHTPVQNHHSHNLHQQRQSPAASQNMTNQGPRTTPDARARLTPSGTNQEQGNPRHINQSHMTAQDHHQQMVQHMMQQHGGHHPSYQLGHPPSSRSSSTTSPAKGGHSDKTHDKT